MSNRDAVATAERVLRQADDALDVGAGPHDAVSATMIGAKALVGVGFALVALARAVREPGHVYHERI